MTRATHHASYVAFTDVLNALLTVLDAKRLINCQVHGGDCAAGEQTLALPGG